MVVVVLFVTQGGGAGGAIGDGSWRMVALFLDLEVYAGVGC